MAARVLSRCVQLGRVTWINSSMRKCSTIPLSKKKVLIKRLPEHIVSLKLGFCDVFLVGTIHSSQKSVAEVQRMIRALKPDVVFLELCPERLEGFKRQEIARKRKNTILPNRSEQLIAYEEAIKYGGKVVLGDRPLKVTKKRFQRKMTPSESELINDRHLRFPIDEFGLPPFFKDCSSISEFFYRYNKELLAENMNMDTINRVNQMLEKILPTRTQTVIHERDIIMAKGILNVVEKSRCVVVVIGNSHLVGIKKHLQHRQHLDELSVNDLLIVPPPTAEEIIITYIGVFMAGVAMILKYL